MKLKCTLQVAFARRQANRNDSEILGECLQHRLWVQRVSYDTPAVLEVNFTGSSGHSRI